MAALGVVSAAVAAILVGGLAVRIGPRWGVVDVADEHLKVHTGSPVPLGGAAVVVGSQVGLAITGLFDPWLLAATVFLWVVGLVDDLRGLSPAVRLAGAVAAGLLLALLSLDPTSWLEGVFWVIAVVVAVNAINLFDGLDALAGSVTTVTFLAISWFAFAQGAGDPVTGVVLAGVMVAFLFWNRPPARLFLGDNGAYVVAILIVWSAEQASPDFGAGVVATGLIGMPLLDLGVTVLRRRLSGVELFAGDRDHTYDRLHKRGLSTGSVSLVFAVLQAIWVSIVVLTSDVAGDRVALAVALLLGLAVVTVAGFRVVRSRGQAV